MDIYTNIEKELLFDLVKKVVNKCTTIDIITNLEIQNLTKPLLEKRGVFITFYIDNNLRGCIGYIQPIIPLYQAVIENAYNAAFKDPRFPPISKKEIPDLKFEISILSKPQKIEYTDFNDLLLKIKKEEDGLILKKGFRSATFLPQVWEQIPEKEDFLSHLCMKAGLLENEWKNEKLEVEKYNVIILHE